MILLKFKGIESRYIMAITIAAITYIILYYIDEEFVASSGTCGGVGSVREDILKIMRFNCNTIIPKYISWCCKLVNKHI